MNVREQIFLTVLLHPKPLHLISINVATSAFNRWCNGHQAESFQTARDQVPFFTEKSAHLCLVTPPLIKTAPGDIFWIFHSTLTLFFICPIPKGKGIYVSDQRMKSTQDEIKRCQNLNLWIRNMWRWLKVQVGQTVTPTLRSMWAVWSVFSRSWSHCWAESFPHCLLPFVFTARSTFV